MLSHALKCMIETCISHLQGGSDALILAATGDHTDVMKVLIDECGFDTARRDIVSSSAYNV